MGSVREQIRLDNTSFCIPVVSSFRYSRIQDKCHALSSVITLGYLETASLEVSMYMRMYFHKISKIGFKLAGKIDKVKLNSGKVVYRQRVEYSSLVNLLKILKHFDIVLVVPETFKIEKWHLKHFRGSISNLRGICKGYEMNEWLTNSLLLQIAFICDLYNVKLRFYKELRDMVRLGVLTKAPYICGKVMAKENYSSIIVIPLSYFREHGLSYLLGKNPKCYILSHKEQQLHIFGYTTKGLHLRRRLVKDGHSSTTKQTVR